MDAKKRNLQRILSLAVVVLLLLGAFAPSALIFVDDSSNTAVAKISEDNIKGENDWTITGTRYINVSKSQDSNIIIDGGKLEINNATLTMLLDEWNAWEIKVRNGGELILWNSTIKTQSRNSQLGPILKMNVSAYGGSKITLRHDSSFTFPGWIYLDNSDLTLKDSSFDKLPDDQIPNTLSLDDNNDCPMLTAKDGSDVLIEDSEINNYYKNEELEGMDWYPSAMGTDTTNEDPNNLTDNTPYKIESGEQMNITQWSHDPYYPLKDYRYVNPYDKISALYIVMNYDVENGYSANDQVYYNTPSGQKQAMQVTSLNPDTDHDIWEIDLNQFKRSGDIFLKNLTVTLTNTDPLNITVQDIKLVSAYNNDINLIDSDMTVINSYIDVDYETADPDPRDEAMYNPPETGTTSETWLEDSSLTHRTLRLYNSSLKGYGLSPSGTWEPSGDPIIVADEKSKNKTWIYRWVTVTPRDSTGTPLNKTDLTVDLSSTISDMSTDLYNNVVAANDPTNNQEAWEYFNKNDFGNYDVGTGTYATNDKGQLTVFLISDRINHPDDWKNGKFVGEYDFDAVHPELGLAQENISLEAFPNLNESANHMYLDILYDDEIDHPDLMVRDSGLNVKYMGTNITYSTIDADLDISLDVNNIGTLNSTNVKVSFYLDDTTNMIDSVVIPRLNKSETKQVSIDWQPTETGTHDIIALVDPDNEMLELRENNNEASTTIDIGEKPNLILNDIFVDAPVIDYTPANEIWIMNHTSRADLSASVSNIGGNAGIMDDATNVRVTFYYANNNTVIGYRDGIDLSETGDSTTTIPIDWNYPGPGDYTIRAMVDSEMVVSEGNETNNNETQKIVVKEGPDVIPSTLSVDPTDPHEDT
ncbi:MAG: CARDB domain-containing protein, partial [Thermoplasmatota archaeon]